MTINENPRQSTPFFRICDLLCLPTHFNGANSSVGLDWYKSSCTATYSKLCDWMFVVTRTMLFVNWGIFVVSRFLPSRRILPSHPLVPHSVSHLDSFSMSGLYFFFVRGSSKEQRNAESLSKLFCGCSKGMERKPHDETKRCDSKQLSFCVPETRTPSLLPLSVSAFQENLFRKTCICSRNAASGDSCACYRPWIRKCKEKDRHFNAGVRAWDAIHQVDSPFAFCVENEDRRLQHIPRN